MQGQSSIRFDAAEITAAYEGRVVWSIRWPDIERIGYRTTDAGPWQDDHFLVFRTKTRPPTYFDVSLSWTGAKELADHVNNLPDTRIPEEGTLANCTDNRSVTVWPADKSGDPLDA
jgi:hypothetical protein